MSGAIPETEPEAGADGVDAAALPLTAGQESLWFLHCLAPASPAYNVVAGLAVRGVLDTGALERAVAAVADRHELMRSVFTEGAGGPVRLLAPGLRPPLEIREVEGVGDERLKELARRAGQEPFRLSEEWPFRVVLLRRAADDAVLVVSSHHIASDATSQWLLVRDLADAYQAAVDGADRAWEAPVASYADHVARERDRRGSPGSVRAGAYWAEVRDGAVAATLQADRPRGGQVVARGATYQRDLGASAALLLRSTAAEAAVSPFGLLLGAFQAAVHRGTGLDDFLIGCPASVRFGRDKADMVGYLVDALVLRSRFGPGTTFREAMVSAHRQLLRGMAHLRYPAAAGPAGAPPFRMAVTLVDIDRLPVPTLPGLHFTLLDLPHMEGQSDLNVELRSGGAGLTIVLRYATDLFDEATIARFAGIYLRLIEAAVENPDAVVAAVPLVESAQYADLLSLGVGGDDDW
ncbi:condensation domain-containing protein [Streptomyces sp. APSN-46.1]|uniref:condensation domain-containing protein n=1 Tax=Streptomyces sp. APSN-46.1 TaxID=2929049 RepID=UPI001FB4215C|nr:condensation domain-containing protein [Streptomyces sp. APSN-46.1]MCJ1678503.1 condensation domain-containing protein [Streptomyces sp. APSN-46.1]